MTELRTEYPALGPSGGDSLGRRFRLVLLLGSLTALGPLTIDLYLPAFPALAADLRTDQPTIQLTLTACLVGLALGQAFAGPLSDALGRRRPLQVGLGLYAVASVLCALAPTVWLLVAGRVVQGLAGAAGLVIARAIVRDLHSGHAAARFFSRLMLVTGLAPILAPTLGGQLLRFTSWPGLFWLLSGVGVLLLAVVSGALRETLPRDRRRAGGVADTLATFRLLLGDRVFLGYALAGGLAFAAMFAYIAGSPFVLHDVYHVSPQEFGLLFGVNAVGLVAASQVNGALVRRFGPALLLRVGLSIMTAGGVALVGLAATGWLGLAGIAAALFAVVAGIGFISPNAIALALADHANAAGTASALLGCLQFVIGAGAAPLVGVLGKGSATPMAVVIAVAAVGALLALLTLTRQPDGRAVSVS